MLLVLPDVEVGDTVPGLNGPLTVASVEDLVLSTTVVLTQDGGPVHVAWHEAPYDGPTVLYERWDTMGGRVAHGFIHPESRKIVQTG
jgi:hypothetical protein